MKDSWVVHLNLSCPAVSQIWSLTALLPILIIFEPNSTPIVCVELLLTIQFNCVVEEWKKGKRKKERKGLSALTFALDEGVEDAALPCPCIPNYQELEQEVWSFMSYIEKREREQELRK